MHSPVLHWNWSAEHLPRSESSSCGVHFCVSSSVAWIQLQSIFPFIVIDEEVSKFHLNYRHNLWSCCIRPFCLRTHRTCTGIYLHRIEMKCIHEPFRRCRLSENPLFGLWLFKSSNLMIRNSYLYNQLCHCTVHWCQYIRRSYIAMIKLNRTQPFFGLWKSERDGKV